MEHANQMLDYLLGLVYHQQHYHHSNFQGLVCLGILVQIVFGE